MKQKILAAVCALALCAALVPAGFAEQAAADTAPVAENLELTTFRGTSIGGTLSANAPDGSPLTFRITTEPIKGTVTLTDSGTFVYTPADGKRGRDYFGFRAADSSGNESQEATVIISIKKQKPAVTYSDMAGRPEEYAAVMLAEQGLCVGRQVGGQYLFDPDSPMPRDEFLAMCTHLTGTSMLQGVLSTGFGDDEQIPAWAKTYVATAVMNGDITGYSDGTAIVFDAQRGITAAEAAVMLSNFLAPSPAAALEGDYIPDWACAAVSSLTSCGVYPAGSDCAALTRLPLSLLSNSVSSTTIAWRNSATARAARRPIRVAISRRRNITCTSG